MDNRKLRSRAKWLAGTVLVLTLILLGGTTSFSKQPPLNHPLGDIPLDAATYRKHLKVWPLDMAGELPAFYDARAEGLVTPAKNQGSCGSCWAFASVGAIESHMLKAFRAGPRDLSEQQQVSCNSAMYGCGGGNSLALKYWETKGPLYESCFPYAGNDTAPCAESQCEQQGYRVVDWHTVAATPGDFKNSLYVYGPSYWRYDVYNDFDTYWNSGQPGEVYVSRSGTYFRGGHAVLLIGWDDTKGAYLCKNSWGGGGPNGDGTFWIAYTGHYHNLGFAMANFSLQVAGCQTNGDCSDGVYCNGTETCVAGACQEGAPPSCADDGLFCSGNEVCDELAQGCGHTGDPCGGGTICDEGTDLCLPLTCGNGICDVGEDCGSCPVDCGSGTGGTCGACFKGRCDGVCDPKKEGLACADCAPTWCCGDGSCEGDETVGSCATDCGCSSDGECNDNEPWTIDVCDAATGGCINTWPQCGLADGSCGPDCTSANDVDCALQCVASTTCNCNGKCGPKETSISCPWDCR